MLVTAIAIALCSYVHFNSEIVDEWASNRVNDDVDNGLQLLGVQSEERWLVLQVEFPNNQFPNSIASEILIGQGSAELNIFSK